ncbi:MAG TPA: cytochrome b/b6 domain-containing protein [Anaerolineales bacterium]|nr:cytochrome b/b6 domain-containing protein [Anaerolineales bacterium]
MNKTPRISILLHWITVLLIFPSAILAKQKELDGLPLNAHTIIGVVLAFTMVIRLTFYIRNFTKKFLIANIVYSLLYIGIFFVLITGVWIAYQRNLIGYLLDPNSAFGRGNFKLLADIHKLGWQILLGWIILHIGTVSYRQFLKKEAILERMWFTKSNQK